MAERTKRRWKIRLKRILPRGLLGRSLLIIVIPLVVLQVVTGIIFYDRHWSTVSRHRANAFVGDMTLIMDLLRHPEVRMSDEEIAALTLGRMNHVVEVVAPESAPAFDGTYEPSGNLERTLAHSLRVPADAEFIIDTESKPDRVIVWIDGGDRVFRFETDSKSLISSTTRIFILWMIGTSIVLFAVATLFMRNQVRPLRRLAKAAEDFGKGRIETDFHPSGAREVRRAAAAFIAMRERIRRQVQQRTEMLAGVSHDLRTPLTRMKLQLAMLVGNKDADELASDVTEMEKMITGYLDFVRGEGTEETQDAALGPIFEEVAKNARINDKQITVNGIPSLTLPVRREAFKRCLTNLVTNGMRHGATRVELSAYRTNGHLVIAIDDDGPGIPEDQWENVFKPFYRIDSSRNLESGGTGLGLSIARDIVRGHGGELTLHDSPLGGLRALIRVPL